MLNPQNPVFLCIDVSGVAESPEHTFINVAPEHRKTMPDFIAPLGGGVGAEAPLPSRGPEFLLTHTWHDNRDLEQCLSFCQGKVRAQ